jgi:hypothetical protein
MKGVHIAVDIMATEIMAKDEQVFSKRFDFAGDELSGEEQAKIL